MSVRRKRSRTRNLDVSKEAKRLGSAILEVLSGLRSPTEASKLLGISPQHYYKLEVRAVQGLLQALESPGTRQRRKDPDKERAKLASERDRLERELQRAQALVRVARRTVGLPAPSDPKKTAKKTGKRRRKPVVRARRLAAELRQEASDKGESSATGNSSAVAAQRSAS